MHGNIDTRLRPVPSKNLEHRGRNRELVQQLDIAADDG